MASSRSDRVWLKARELAAREGVALSTVRRWIAKGVLERDALAPRTGVRVRYAERASTRISAH